MTDQQQQPKTRGQLDYERALARQPNYHNGGPRPTWEKLDDLARWSWERDGGAIEKPAS
ncbi:MAG TPA: hypothetical protein VK634_19700 [Reyranella sp.]|nr:hypothetical protein [Reyranella sp.]HTE82920.1 hypothetical protein [Reyranella sp.]